MEFIDFSQGCGILDISDDIFYLETQHVCCYQLQHFNLFMLYLIQQGHSYFHKYNPVQEFSTKLQFIYGCSYNF